jgi:hypothetical protein
MARRNSPPLGFLFVMAAVCMVGYMFTDISRRRHAEQEGAPITEQASLTALTVKQSKGVEFFAPRGAPRAHVASFEFETNPDPMTSVELLDLNIEILDAGLVLRDLEFEVESYTFTTDPVDVGSATNVRHFWLPRQYSNNFRAGKKFYANLYATIDKSSREGTYTRPVRLTGWSAKDRGMNIPFPGTVNGQPIIVMP